MPFRCSSGAAHPPPPRPLPCLHSSSLQFHAYIVSYTPAQSSLARLGPMVPPPEINVLIWNISERRLEPRACQSRAFCPLPGASAMVGGLGGRGKGAIPSPDFPGARTPSRPPCTSLAPTVDKNKRSPSLSQSPGSAARNTPRVLPVPLKHPPHEGRKGSSLVCAPPPLAGPGRRRLGVPLGTGKWPQDRYSGAAPGGLRQEAGRVLAGSSRGCGVHAEVAAV